MSSIEIIQKYTTVDCIFLHEITQNLSNNFFFLKHRYFLEYIVRVCSDEKTGHPNDFLHELSIFQEECLHQTYVFMSSVLNQSNVPVLYSHFLIHSRRESGFIHMITTKFLSSTKCGYCTTCRDPLLSIAKNCEGRRSYFFGRVDSSVYDFFFEYISSYISLLTFVLFFHPNSHEYVCSIINTSNRKVENLGYIFQGMMSFEQTNQEKMTHVNDVPNLFHPYHVSNNFYNPYSTFGVIGAYFISGVDPSIKSCYYPLSSKDDVDNTDLHTKYISFLRLFYYYRSVFTKRTDQTYELTRVLFEKMIGSSVQIASKEYRSHFLPFLPGFEDLVGTPVYLPSDSFE